MKCIICKLRVATVFQLGMQEIKTDYCRTCADKHLNRRADGRLERVCEHRIGHTIRIPEGKDKSWWIHTCDGCCKNYKRIGVE